MESSYAKTAIAGVLAGVVGLASYGVVRETRAIGEGKIVVATGSSQYFERLSMTRRCASSSRAREASGESAKIPPRLR